MHGLRVFPEGEDLGCGAMGSRGACGKGLDRC